MTSAFGQLNLIFHVYLANCVCNAEKLELKYTSSSKSDFYSCVCEKHGYSVESIIHKIRWFISIAMQCKGIEGSYIDCFALAAVDRAQSSLVAYLSLGEYGTSHGKAEVRALEKATCFYLRALHVVVRVSEAPAFPGIFIVHRSATDYCRHVQQMGDIFTYAAQQYRKAHCALLLEAERLEKSHPRTLPTQPVARSASSGVSPSSPLSRTLTVYSAFLRIDGPFDQVSTFAIRGTKASESWKRMEAFTATAKRYEAAEELFGGIDHIRKPGGGLPAVDDNEDECEGTGTVGQTKTTKEVPLAFLKSEIEVYMQLAAAAHFSSAINSNSSSSSCSSSSSSSNSSSSSSCSSSTSDRSVYHNAITAAALLHSQWYRRESARYYSALKNALSTRDCMSHAERLLASAQDATTLAELFSDPMKILSNVEEIRRASSDTSVLKRMKKRCDEALAEEKPLFEELIRLRRGVYDSIEPHCAALEQALWEGNGNKVLLLQNNKLAAVKHVDDVVNMIERGKINSLFHTRNAAAYEARASVVLTSSSGGDGGDSGSGSKSTEKQPTFIWIAIAELSLELDTFFRNTLCNVLAKAASELDEFQDGQQNTPPQLPEVWSSYSGLGPLRSLPACQALEQALLYLQLAEYAYHLCGPQPGVISYTAAADSSIVDLCMLVAEKYRAAAKEFISLTHPNQPLHNFWSSGSRHSDCSTVLLYQANQLGFAARLKLTYWGRVQVQVQEATDIEANNAYESSLNTQLECCALLEPFVESTPSHPSHWGRSGSKLWRRLIKLLVSVQRPVFSLSRVIDKQDRFVDSVNGAATVRLTPSMHAAAAIILDNSCLDPMLRLSLPPDLSDRAHQYFRYGRMTWSAQGSARVKSAIKEIDTFAQQLKCRKSNINLSVYLEITVGSIPAADRREQSNTDDAINTDAAIDTDACVIDAGITSHAQFAELSQSNCHRLAILLPLLPTYVERGAISIERLPGSKQFSEAAKYIRIAAEFAEEALTLKDDSNIDRYDSGQDEEDRTRDGDMKQGLISACCAAIGAAEQFARAASAKIELAKAVCTQSQLKREIRVAMCTAREEIAKAQALSAPWKRFVRSHLHHRCRC